MALLPPSKKKRGPPKGFVANPAGKAKGTKNRRTIGKELLAAKQIDSGLMPLDFALQILRDQTGTYGKADKMWAAQVALPYTHKKMPIAIEGGDKPISIIDATKVASMGEKEIEQLIVVLQKLGVAAGDESLSD